MRATATVAPGIGVLALFDHLQGVRDCASGPQAALAVPWPGVCGRIQGDAADIQVRRAAVVQRHPQQELQGELHERVRRAQGQDGVAGYRWQVRTNLGRMTFLCLWNLSSDVASLRSSLTGIGEVVLLPLDALKIKRQVNPEAFRGRGVVRIFLEEGTTLYRGWGWTIARNAPGSFAVRSYPS